MLQRLPQYTLRWRARDMSDAAYAGVYFLLWQMDRHGERFASRRRKSDPRPDARAWLTAIHDSSGADLTGTLRGWFANYQFLAIIPNVPAALYHWLAGAWPLQLLERIPSPREVLEMQAEGSRPVTVLSGFPRLMRPVLSKPDAFAFMVHDLEHAYKLLHDPDLRDGQTSFFRALRESLRQGWFEGYMNDAVFADKFDYLISDMNTHPLHGLQYLRAILLECHLRREGKPASAAVSPAAWAEIGRLLDAWGLKDAAAAGNC